LCKCVRKSLDFPPILHHLGAVSSPAHQTERPFALILA
jgi:hypothetical protein